VSLILVGQLPLDEGPATPSLPPIQTPVAATATPTPEPASDPSLAPSTTPAPTPVPTPIPDDWVMTQIQVESVNVNVAVQEIGPGEPLGTCCAYLLARSEQPGRGTNAYVAGHALLPLFKGLWNVQLGAEVRVLMSDGIVLRYRVTEVRPNISCPDPNAPTMQQMGFTPPLALQHAPPGCVEGARWTAPTDHEQLTMQTSQGFNRNWGELIVIALPIEEPA
jgi:hypothetical protein